MCLSVLEFEVVFRADFQTRGRHPGKSLEFEISFSQIVWERLLCRLHVLNNMILSVTYKLIIIYLQLWVGAEMIRYD